MSLPRILVIDDQFGRRTDLQEEWADSLGLLAFDATAPDIRPPKYDGEYLAAVAFCSGQSRQGTTVTNDLGSVLDAVGAGWPGSGGWHWALVLVDLRFDSQPRTPEDEHFGLRVLEALVDRWPDPHAPAGNTALPVVMLSSLPRTLRAHAANRAGARQYVEKEVLDRKRLTQLLDQHGLLADDDPLGRAPQQRLIGHSQPFLSLLRQARRIARLGGRGNALLRGPQGVGKSSLAAYIHAHSRRGGRLLTYFVTPSAAAMEYAALFGAWEGAYTDQRRDSYPGLAEVAQGGTLLIDEVHALTPQNQAELLEFARLDGPDRRWLTRLGKNFPDRPSDVVQRARRSLIGKLDSATSRIAIEVLLLTASSEPLEDPHWRRNHFSDPLYTRLAEEYAAGPLHIPALSERPDDVIELFEYFLATQRSRDQTLGAWLLDSETIDVLRAYSWPGNVAELSGVALYSAQAAHDYDVVLPRHLPPKMQSVGAVRPRPAADAVISPEQRGSGAPGPDAGRWGTDRGILLEDLIALMEGAAVPSRAASLESQGRQLQQAYGGLLMRLVEEALDITQLLDGDPQRSTTLGRLSPTRAVKLLLGVEDLSATAAASELLRWAKLMPEPPAERSHLALALTWAKTRRAT